MHSCWTVGLRNVIEIKSVSLAGKETHGRCESSALTFGRVFETEVRDGSKELGLEEEITETCRVDADVGALLFAEWW